MMNQSSTELLKFTKSISYGFKWPQITSSHIIEIAWTFNISQVIDRVNHPWFLGFFYNVLNQQYSINSTTAAKLVNELSDNDLRNEVTQAFENWGKSINGLIKFTYVSSLEAQKGNGIVVATCGRYSIYNCQNGLVGDLDLSNSMDRRLRTHHLCTDSIDCYDNDSIEFSLICLPRELTDFFGVYNSITNYGCWIHNQKQKQGYQLWFQWSISHEIGHALGLSHPDDDQNDTLSRWLLDYSDKTKECNTTIMGYPDKTCSPFIKSNENEWERYISSSIQSTPGILDILAIRGKYEIHHYIFGTAYNIDGYFITDIGRQNNSLRSTQNKVVNNHSPQGSLSNSHLSIDFSSFVGLSLKNYRQPSNKKTAVLVQESKPMIQTYDNYTASSWFGFPTMLLQQISKSATSIANIFSNYVDNLVDSAREYATQVTEDCSSYFPKGSPNYWRNGGSHTLLFSRITENALSSNDTCLLTYTPTTPLLGVT